MSLEHTPDPSLHYVIGFSGGKDSVASWLYLSRELSLPKVTALFADTGHEFPETYEYLETLRNEHDLPLEIVTPTVGDLIDAKEIREKTAASRISTEGYKSIRDIPLTMERLAILKRRFPSTMARFCTTMLKLLPSLRWMQEHCDLASTVRVSGVRAEESPGRAKQAQYEFDDYMGCWMWKPVFHWCHAEVFGAHQKHGIPVNPLYKQGMGRVGCAPCIMANKEELHQIAVRKPEAFDRLRSMEDAVAKSAGKSGMSFFSNHKTPERFHDKVCDNTGKSYPSAEAVKRWAMGVEPGYFTETPLFEEDWTEDVHSCSSKYGLCE